MFEMSLCVLHTNHPCKLNFGVKKHDVAHVPGPDYVIIKFSNDYTMAHA
jgi:hypothetical protein